MFSVGESHPDFSQTLLLQTHAIGIDAVCRLSLSAETCNTFPEKDGLRALMRNEISGDTKHSSRFPV